MRDTLASINCGRPSDLNRVKRMHQSMDRSNKEYSDNKLVKRLQKEFAKAVTDFNMIEEGDRVMVCLFGGKLY